MEAIKKFFGFGNVTLKQKIDNLIDLLKSSKLLPVGTIVTRRNDNSFLLIFPESDDVALFIGYPVYDLRQRDLETFPYSIKKDTFIYMRDYDRGIFTNIQDLVEYIHEFYYFITKYKQKIQRKKDLSLLSEFPKDECVLCLKNLASKDCVVTKCNHSFHRECLKKWFDKIELENRILGEHNMKTCPICRQEDISMATTRKCKKYTTLEKPDAGSKRKVKSKRRSKRKSKVKSRKRKSRARK